MSTTPALRRRQRRPESGDVGRQRRLDVERPARDGVGEAQPRGMQGMAIHFECDSIDLGQPAVGGSRKSSLVGAVQLVPDDGGSE